MSRFAFVAAERANHAVATLCRIIGASVSGFYAWLRAIPAARARAEAEAELRGHIGRVFAAGRRVYGAPRLRRSASTALPGSMPSCAGRAGGSPAGVPRG